MVIRHELGHAIGTGAVHKEWKKMIADTYGYPADGFFKVMKEKVSQYAAYYKPGQSNPDIYEALAETFAKVTSHDYKPGTLPRPIEDFIYTKMLGCKPKKASDGGGNGGGNHYYHLMYDPATFGKDTGKTEAKATATQTQTDDLPSLDDIASWFAPKKEVAKATAQKVKTPELAYA